MQRRTVLGMAAAALTLSPLGVRAQSADGPELSLQVHRMWMRLVLELVRHTPTYSPPVASRGFAYIGIAAYELVAATTPGMRTLAGQLPGLAQLPAAPGDVAPALVLQAGLADTMAAHFANTGPTGQRALQAMTARLDAQAEAGLPADVVTASRAYGRALSQAILAWAATDGATEIENLGFPRAYTLGSAPGAWVPTGAIQLQQLPLLPAWGAQRPFAMPDAALCDLPPPPDYSEAPGSAFRAEAEEVVAVSKALTDDQKQIARFWSDDPMLSPTPPGHWVSIALQCLAQEGAGMARQAEVLARLGITVADAFIACWATKYRYDLLRPVTYIRRVLDPGWEPLLITPPFPEYPSGHSTQSGAAASVLTAAFGEGYAFTDATHEDDGLPSRAFPDFWSAAEEAALSRLYGGIHFRSAVARGLDQGRCVGAHAVALRLGVA